MIFYNLKRSIDVPTLGVGQVAQLFLGSKQDVSVLLTLNVCKEEMFSTYLVARRSSKSNVLGSGGVREEGVLLTVRFKAWGPGIPSSGMLPASQELILNNAPWWAKRITASSVLHPPNQCQLLLYCQLLQTRITVTSASCCLRNELLEKKLCSSIVPLINCTYELFNMKTLTASY